jgi:AraC-like DNA-binding protein
MAAEPGIRPRRRSFATSDPVAARDFIDLVYRGPRMQIQGDRDAEWRASLSEVSIGQIAVCELRVPGRLAFEVDRGEEVVVGTVLGGSARISRGGTDTTYGRDQVFVGIRPDARLPSRTDDLQIHTVALPPTLLFDLASERPGPPRPLSKLLAPDADRDRARRWRDVVRFIDAMLAEEEIAVSPLVLGPAERLLAATLLSFAGPEDEEAAARDAHPAALRRAIAFIDANADRDLTLAEIGRAARVSPRSVQLAFRRHLDLTPVAYLRQVRLGHAHAQLEGAVEGDGQTVTSIATDWGFANAGRFARLYREAYGVSPSVTLRRW